MLDSGHDPGLAFALLDSLRPLGGQVYWKTLETRSHVAVPHSLLKIAVFLSN